MNKPVYPGSEVHSCRLQTPYPLRFRMTTSVSIHAQKLQYGTTHWANPALVSLLKPTGYYTVLKVERGIGTIVTCMQPWKPSYLEQPDLENPHSFPESKEQGAEALRSVLVQWIKLDQTHTSWWTFHALFIENLIQLDPFQPFGMKYGEVSAEKLCKAGT